METAWVYTLASNTWAITNTTTGSGSNYPSARSGHTAVISKFITFIIYFFKVP
jgi:hypothetical protein